MFSKLLKLVMIMRSPLLSSLVRLNFTVFSGGKYAQLNRQSSSPNVGVKQLISLAALGIFCNHSQAHVLPADLLA